MPKVPDCVVCYCFFGQKTSQKMTMKDIYHKKRLWGPGEIIKNTALIHFHYVLRVWNEWVFVIFTINYQRIRNVIHQEQNFIFRTINSSLMNISQPTALLLTNYALANKFSLISKISTGGRYKVQRGGVYKVQGGTSIRYWGLRLFRERGG